MTKDQFNRFTLKSDSFFKKAKILYWVYILIFVVLFIGMLIYQVISLFMTFIMIVTIMALLYHFVFKEYIFFTRKLVEFMRISDHQQFKVSEEVVAFFDENIFQKLYDNDYELAVKNDVYVIASKQINDSIHTLGLAVYYNDLETEAVSATPKMLSNEISGFVLKSSIIKVILLVSDKFDQEEKEYLKFDSFFHKNTVVIGLEKSTKTLYYNYFLNGEELDTHLSDLFKVDLTLEDFSDEEEV
jgi:hypothetical protein